MLVKLLLPLLLLTASCGIDMSLSTEVGNSSSGIEEPFNLTESNSSQAITLSWEANNEYHSYRVSYIEGDTAPSSCSIGTIISEINQLSVVVSNLDPFKQYSFRLCTMIGDLSSTGVTKTVQTSCPDNYLPVPSDGIYTFQDFCVMKYEAKAESLSVPNTYQANGCNGGGASCTQASSNWGVNTHIPKSTAEAKPWRNISRENAIRVCRNLNSETNDIDIDSDMNNDGIYDLISNDEWQTIATNIAVQYSGVNKNWDLDRLGHIVLNQGHSDGDPNFACDGANEYINGDCFNSGIESDFGQKRTHFLSNGEVLWDFSGNVSEWVKEDNNLPISGAISTWSTLIDANSDGLSDSYLGLQNLFGPNDLTPSICSNPGVGTNCGLGYLFDGAAGAIIRGSTWSGNAPGGVFSTILYNASNIEDPSNGFRCRFVK